MGTRRRVNLAHRKRAPSIEAIKIGASMTDVYWYLICRANGEEPITLPSIVGAAIRRWSGDRMAKPPSGSARSR